MNFPQLATVLLDRVTRSATPTVLVGEMQNLLGADAFSEALRLRWLSHDVETGGLTVANSSTMMNQLREVASGNLQSLGADVSNLSTVQEADGGYQVGDEVMTTVNGRPVNARVKSVRPDGTMELDYPSQNRPANSAPVKRDMVKPISRPTIKPGSTGSAAAQPPTNQPLTQNPTTKAVQPDPSRSSSPLLR